MKKKPKGRRTRRVNNSLPCSFCGNGFDPENLIPVKTDRICQGCLDTIGKIAEQRHTDHAMKLVVVVEGARKTDLAVGLQEAARKFDEGNLAGFDENDDAKYRFDIYGEPDEDPLGDDEEDES